MCVLLSVCPQVCIGCFCKLMVQSVGITQHTTMPKKKKKAKKPTNCPLCFLEFINSVLTVLSAVLGVMFIKIKKKLKKQEGCLPLKISA